MLFRSSTVTESTTATSEPSTPTPVPTPSPTPEPAVPVAPTPQPEPRPVPTDQPVIPQEPVLVPPATETQSQADTSPVVDTPIADQPADATGTDTAPQPSNGDSSNAPTPVEPTPSKDSSQSSESTKPSTPSVPSIPEPPKDKPVTPTPTTPETTPKASNTPSSLPDTIPVLPPKEALVPRVQVDVAGVANGGIQFYGTKTAPQVIGEDGKITPPAPPPGSGLPIPPDAITIVDTFIGQPGGTTFNAPDVAVPVIETPVEGALAVVPGVQALNHAFVAMSNIGNDMSPVTRKKAKKILVITTVIAAVGRRFK